MPINNFNPYAQTQANNLIGGLEMEVKRLPESELTHHGIKGQKWGIRRYQNPDGSLTAAGQARYTYKERKKSLSRVSNMSSEDMQKAINRMRLEKTYKQTTKDNLREAKRDSDSPLKTAGKIAAGAALAAGTGIIVANAIKTGKKYASVSKTLDTLSNSQLESKIARLQLEKTFSDLSKSKLNKSRSTLSNIMEQAGTTVLASAITGATALALRTAITGSTDAETAANYIAPKPGGKKK